MAGDYIIMRVDLVDDPDVLRIGKLTGLEIERVIGKLHKLWSWADRHTRDGFVDGFDAQWIDELVSCEGFFAALIDREWAQTEGTGIRLLNFEKHNASNAKSRADGRKRQQKYRENHSVTRNANVTGMSQKSNANSVTREEKRREEKSNTNTPYKSPKGDAASAEKIYQAYPRKVAKGNAIKAIRKALQIITFEDLLPKVEEFARCVSVPGVDESFIPHPATWFNAQRWTDDPADWQRIGRNRAGPLGRNAAAPGPSQGIMDWAATHGVTDGKS